MKNPLHRVGDVHAEKVARHCRRELASRQARRRKALVPGRKVAATDDHVALAVSQCRQHLDKQRLVMLKVGVHDGDEGSTARQHSLDAGASKPTPADASDAANAGIGLREILRHLRRPVGRIVIDKDDLPSNALERLAYALDDQGDIGRFIEAWNDYRELGAGRRSHAMVRKVRSRLSGLLHELSP